MSDKKQIIIEIENDQVKVGITKGVSDIEALINLNDAMNTIMNGMKSKAEALAENIKKGKVFKPGMIDVIKSQQAKIN